MELPERKRLRLENYNYSENGMYFITVCTQNRKKVLSEILSVGDGSPVPKLTATGMLAESYIGQISEKYPTVKIYKYIIMPDHIHFLISIEKNTGGTGDPSPTTSTVFAWFKYQTTKAINMHGGCVGKKFWQRSFFDHVVRNEQDLQDIMYYIETNPQRWIEKYRKSKIHSEENGYVIYKHS